MLTKHWRESNLQLGLVGEQHLLRNIRLSSKMRRLRHTRKGSSLPCRCRHISVEGNRSISRCGLEDTSKFSTQSTQRWRNISKLTWRHQLTSIHHHRRTLTHSTGYLYKWEVT